MKHEKIFKRPDGSRVKITVIVLDTRQGHIWNHICARSKDGERGAISDTFATPAEILQTKLELWQKIKPE